MNLRTLALLTMIPMGLAACQSTDWSTGETVGTLGGAAGGAILGSQIGKGTGRDIAMVGGALLGAFLGNQLGQRLSENDKQMAASTAQQSLERQPSGTTSSWQNPDSGNAGSFQPQNVYQTLDGTYCRQYANTIVVDGRTETVNGTACRNADGSWRIVQ